MSSQVTFYHDEMRCTKVAMTLVGINDISFAKEGDVNRAMTGYTDMSSGKELVN